MEQDTINIKEYKRYRQERTDADAYFPEGTVHEDVYVKLGDRLFVWDKPKNDVNKAEHGIDFYTAIYVFNDEDRLEDENTVVDGDERQQAIGEPKPPVIADHPIDTKHARPKAVIGEIEGILFIVFTYSEAMNGEATRIISARAADKDEVAAYFEWKYGG